MTGAVMLWSALWGTLCLDGGGVALGEELGWHEALEAILTPHGP
jgi:hypothetical protein